MQATQANERRRRKWTRRAWMLSLCTLTLLLIGSAASAGSTTPVRTTAGRSASDAQIAAGSTAASGPLQATGLKRWGAPYSSASGYDRYSYVLVERKDAKAAARLPGTSLVYMSGTTIHKPWSTGVSHGEALANGWLLKTDNGADVMNAAYRGYIGDIGNRAYQQRFVDNVSAFLKSTKVDGVFIDDVIAHPFGLTGGVYPSKYPTAEAWEAAIVSFVETVGPALRAKGWYVLVSALKFVPGDLRSNSAEPTAEFWSRIAPYVSGLTSEYWLQNPNDIRQLRARGSQWYEQWNSWQSLVSVAQRAGRDFFAISYGSSSDTRAMRYLRASFLLDWNGRGGALIYSTTDNPDPFHPVWVRQLGSPSRPKFERASGVWQRRYEKGIVVVNTTNAPVTVRVNGVLWTIGPADALMAAAPKKART